MFVSVRPFTDRLSVLLANPLTCKLLNGQNLLSGVGRAMNASVRPVLLVAGLIKS